MFIVLLDLTSVVHAFEIFLHTHHYSVLIL